MPRSSSSFAKLLAELAAYEVQRKRLNERAHAEKIREYERAQGEIARKKDLADKEAYLARRLMETESKNNYISYRLSELSNLLSNIGKATSKISFESLKKSEKFGEFIIPEHLQSRPQAPQLEEYHAIVKQPRKLEKFIPKVKKRYQMALDVARNQYKHAYCKWDAEVQKREFVIKKLRDEYERDKERFDKGIQHYNDEICRFNESYKVGDPEAITEYCKLVLALSKYPEGFPQKFKLAYIPESKELVTEYELPSIEVIPTVSEYRYVKSKDVIVQKPRKEAELLDIYQDIIASICLRTIHEIFESDQYDFIQVIAFNGFLQTIDPSTGHDIKLYVISVRTIKERFGVINLYRVDKRACLKNLGAQVSSHPNDLQAVKPIVFFDMVDKRFVEQSDILSDLDSRPNIMELNPFEFENLVSNLFGLIGFQTKQTRSTKDSGVDAIAYDPRPILGGKVVIQAKRYKNVVGVAVVRDLYGTMINEGASKGILVTTSHYGSDAYDFARDKPIELIDGGGLLYFLGEQGIKAKIIMPED